MPPCPECADGAARDQRFCEACGRNLQLHSDSTTTASKDTAPRPCSGCGAPPDDPAEEYCAGCGLRRPDGTERVELDLGALAGVSDRGRVRPRNEDALALGRQTDGRVTAAVVCDGVSRGHRPELASRAAADAALSVLLTGHATLSGPRRTLRAVTAAAEAVSSLDPPPTGEPSSCTLVCALVEENGHGCEITVGWVGDSRAYWLSDGGGEPARLLTADHSWMADQVAAGVDESVALQHRLAHAITRWLGPDAEPEPDVVTLRPAGPGVLLLCSDGLWNYRPDADDLAATVSSQLAAGPLRAAVMLTTVALEAGGEDNVTVAVVPVGAATERSPS